MGKPKKNKSGLHKHVSSVLKGVRIPQGVHNWRPPDVPGLDRIGDSPEIPKSTVSSVFEGLSVLAASDSIKPTCKHSQDCSSDTSQIQTPEGSQTSQNDMAKNLDGPEESSASALRTGQSESVNRLARYRDSQEQAPRLSLREWIRERLFGAKE